VNILEELGLTEDEFEWRDLALCKGLSPVKDEDGKWRDFFFDDYETDQNTARTIDSVCLSCPVFKDCFAAGQDGGIGVWGGVYWNGAGKPDKNKNSHKTDEDWDNIRNRLTGE